jgi:hypothetical protein
MPLGTRLGIGAPVPLHPASIPNAADAAAAHWTNEIFIFKLLLTVKIAGLLILIELHLRCFAVESEVPKARP